MKSLKFKKFGNDKKLICFKMIIKLYWEYDLNLKWLYRKEFNKLVLIPISVILKNFP